MTGRELIVYILENRLENEKVFTNDTFLDYLSIEETASILRVGVPTVITLIGLGTLPHVSIGGKYYIPKDISSKVKIRR